MQAKMTAFLCSGSHGASSTGSSSPNKQQRSAKPQQQRLGDLPGVLRLPKMSGYAPEKELRRLLGELDGGGEEGVISALKQLACYQLTVDQLERVPLGKRVKQLRQHESGQVREQAARLLAKMRQDVVDACARAKAQPRAAGRLGAASRSPKKDNRAKKKSGPLAAAAAAAPQGFKARSGGR